MALRNAAALREKARMMHDQGQRTIQDVVPKAKAAGVPVSELAEILGVTRQGVYWPLRHAVLLGGQWAHGPRAVEERRDGCGHHPGRRHQPFRGALFPRESDERQRHPVLQRGRRHPRIRALEDQARRPLGPPEQKRLFLLRHAKSSWEDPQADDHDRPLASRGHTAARLMAEHLRRAGIRPSLVLCSSARRARETLDELALEGEVRIERELYGGSAGQLLERLQRLPDPVESSMLIGHNPAIQTLAVILAGGGTQLARIQRKFPTGALAALTFAGDWRGLRPGSADLTAFVRPKQLR
jgi:phosphohistidine phosphatase